MVAAEKQPIIDDQKQRNAVVAEGFCAAVGKIGQGKRRYGLALILEKLPVTQGASIAMNILVMNLQKLLELLFIFLIFLLGLFDASLGLQRGHEEGLSYPLTGA